LLIDHEAPLPICRTHSSADLASIRYLDRSPQRLCRINPSRLAGSVLPEISSLARSLNGRRSRGYQFVMSDSALPRGHDVYIDGDTSHTGRE